MLDEAGLRFRESAGSSRRVVRRHRSEVEGPVVESNARSVASGLAESIVSHRARPNTELLLSAKASRSPLVTPVVCEACGCGSRIPGR